MNDLPKQPPEGKKRWKAYFRDPAESPFADRQIEVTQTVDLDEKLSRAEVEQLAREAPGGFEFDRLEEL
jgi:hypothetical protein